MEAQKEQKDNEQHKEDNIQLLPSSQQKIDEAIKLKEQGNKFFMEKNYKKALSCWARVFCYVTGLYPPSDQKYYEQAGKNLRLTVEQGKIIEDLKFKTYLNMSQVDIYNKNYKRAIERLVKALKINQTAKAYYRKGLAEYHLKEYFFAEEDFLKVKELDPKNKAVDKYMKLIQKAEKNNTKEMQKNLKKMFD